MEKSFVIKLSCVLALYLSVSLTGCSRSTEVWFYGPSGKEEQLEKRIADFHQAVYWADTRGALSLVEPSQRSAIASKLPKETRKEQFVRFDVASSTPTEEDSSIADVTLKVQLYRIPNYRIENVIVKEKWVFHRFGGGWYYSEGDLFSTDTDTDKTSSRQ